ncbi:trypsin-like peptidase domain-containing protein [Streptomyces sp. Da 82-17]|uniref:nSTAND1 domain-containing NTPase n=1 Tax=Streptomyces sp. Da 82-17 TaxID=3377116 RepID=UPI0038D365A6
MGDATAYPGRAVLRIFGPPTEADGGAGSYGSRPGSYVSDAYDSDPYGVAFLVDDRHAITCAHVVAAALGLDDGERPDDGARLRVDLPLLPGAPATDAGTAAVTTTVTAAVTASVALWGPDRTPDGGGDDPDVAVLRLDAPLPGGAAPAQVVDVEPEELRGHAAQIVGFPEGRGQGVWHEGVLRGPQADGQIQIDRAGEGYRVSRGFSGSPVWSRDVGAVVGMTVKAELGEPAAAFMIPVARLAAVWPPLTALTRPASPFRSLEPFEEAHAAAFFGRTDDSARVARVVAGRRWTTLVGPSGCGKSSLAMAGVAPLRRADGDTVAVLRPAHHAGALRGLASVLLDLLEPHAGEAEKFARISAVADEIAAHGMREVVSRVLRVQRAARLLIVVDQFEELLDEEHFTPDDIAALSDALGPKAPPVVSVLAVLRADFLGPVLAHPRLGLLAKARVEAVEPMRREQLRDVVTRPVEAIPAVSYEENLVDRILADVGGASGVLPLLSFTLAQLWDAQRAGRLTHDAYTALGGVTGALGRHADRVWEQHFGQGDHRDERQHADQRHDDRQQASQQRNEQRHASQQRNDQQHAERLLTRLVRTPVGTDTPVRRTVARSELSEPEWRIAQRLAGARLLVLNQGQGEASSTTEGEGPDRSAFASETVELAHEALISSWDRLSSRVRDDRVFLDWRENLQLDLDRWNKSGRSKDLLPTATALDAAERWLPERSDELAEEQREFVRQGRAHRRRLTRRRRAVMALFGVLLLAVSVAAGVAVDQRQTVVEQRDRATSAQVAGLAESVGRTDPRLARRLAVAAARLGDTPEAWSTLLTVRNQPEQQAVKLPEFDVKSAALDDTGRILVAGGGTHVGTWDVQTGKRLGTFRTAERVRNVRMSGDGSTVAVSTDDETTVVLETRGLERRGNPYPTGPAVFSLSPKGTFLASSVDHEGKGTYVLTVRNTRTGKALGERTSSDPIDTAFSADEKRLSLTTTGSERGTVAWLDLRTGDNLRVPDFEIKPEHFPGPMVFSPDGTRTAVLTDKGLRVAGLLDEGDVGFYDFTGVPKENADESQYGDDVRFSHDGKFVAVGFTLWDATFSQGDEPVFTYPTAISQCYPGTFRFSADDSEMRCVGDDGTFRSIDVSRVTSAAERPSGGGGAVAASADGSTLAVLGGGEGRVQIWSTSPLARRREFTLPQTPAYVLLSPDGKLLAVRHSLNRVQIWDTVRRKKLGTLPGSMGGITTTVAISPDGRTYVTYDREGSAGAKGYVETLRFYDLRTMKLIKKRSFELRTSLIDFSTRVTFRPDGKAVTVSPLLGTVAVPSGKVLVRGTQGLHLDGYGPDGTTAYTNPTNVRSQLSFLDPRTLRPEGEPLDVGVVPSMEDVPVHSPDGRLVAVKREGAEAADDVLAEADEVRLWDIRTRRRIGPALADPAGSVSPVTFTADGSALIATDGRGAFRTYPVSRARLTRELCALSDGGLTEREWARHIPDVPYRETC